MASHSRKNYTRAEREAMVVTTFAIDIQHRDHKWLTSNEIARRLDMARNGRFKAMLDEMVLDGRLISRVDPYPKHWPGYQYKLAPGTYQEPTKRTIKLSVKGKQWEEVFG